jgi:hypothetical protein
MTAVYCWPLRFIKMMCFDGGKNFRFPLNHIQNFPKISTCYRSIVQFLPKNIPCLFSLCFVQYLHDSVCTKTDYGMNVIVDRKVDQSKILLFLAVFRIRIPLICKIFGLPDLDPEPLVRGPNPSIIKQN